MLVRKAYGLLAAIATPFASGALTLDVNDQNSIKTAAKSVAENMLTFYPGNKPGGTPGILAQPYYWWEAGAMMGQLINYWNLTGDTSYNDLVYQAMLYQVGSDRNYMPQNQTKDLGNDDQVFWAFAAMDAAEANFKNPPSSEPQWLALAQAVYNSQLPRWETSSCNGGLRWQIYQFNAGYDYKNTISTGGLFQLAARLARFTGNSTYGDWAEKTWNWMYGTPIFGKTNGVADGNIWDGVYIVNNCSAATQTYWSYNVGTVLAGAAYMYNYTNGSSLWKDRLDLAIKGTQVFFVDSSGTNAQGGQPANNNGSIAAEVACEPPDPQTCNNDEPSFKAYLMRWLAVTSQLAPYTHDLVMKRLQASAQAAAGQCSGSINGLTNACGRRWYQTTWDGTNGVGEQMSAMSVIQNNLIDHVSPPATGLPSGGGTSQGDANAGIGTSDSDELGNDGLTRPITTGDRAGAGILTALALILVIGGTWWMII